MTYFVNVDHGIFFRYDTGTCGIYFLLILLVFYEAI